MVSSRIAAKRFYRRTGKAPMDSNIEIPVWTKHKSYSRKQSPSDMRLAAIQHGHLAAVHVDADNGEARSAKATANGRLT